MTLRIQQCNSMVSELFANLRRFDYRIYCQLMIECDAVRMDKFNTLTISENHYIDIRHCFVEGVFNPSHILDYFSRYSGQDCFELRKQILDIMKQDRDHWIHVSSVVLPLHPQGFDEWVSYMENPLNPCDELFLFALSKRHFRHTIVYNHKRAWCTIQSFKHLTDNELYAACDLHLIYLGQDVYGEILPLIEIPKSLQSFKVGFQEKMPSPEHYSDDHQKDKKDEISNRDIDDIPVNRHKMDTPSDTSALPIVSSNKLPLLPVIILPLKLLIVEYLCSCDSALVNPIVFTLAGNSKNMDIQPIIDGVHLKPVLQDDMKSPNKDEHILDYDKYLLPHWIFWIL